MGRESERQIVKTEILADVASMLRDSLVLFEKAIETAKNNELIEIEVRHLPKGRAAIKDLMEFSNTLQVSVSETLLPNRKKIYSLMQPTNINVAKNKPEPVKPVSVEGSKRPRKRES
ncbi:MAG: hypothetical protein ACK5S6_05525 [bacterium]|jgi:hypothetical protein